MPITTPIHESNKETQPSSITENGCGNIMIEYYLKRGRPTPLPVGG